MQIIIVSHYKRSDWVRKLLDVFPGAFVVVDFLDRGSLWAHTEAIKLAALLNVRCIIMEDDASIGSSPSTLSRISSSYFPAASATRAAARCTG